jgi:hypothetical protein
MRSPLDHVTALLELRGGTGDDLALLARARSSEGTRTSPGLGLLDRHRLELLSLAARGHVQRAVVLSREHLNDFPDDALIEALVDVLEAAERPNGEPPAST